MGMDVYGKNPASDCGEYFRNNVWWWHPLWDYCLEMHADICGSVECGHSNDGDGLDTDDARELGLRLLNDIDLGEVEEYETAFNLEKSELPVSECGFCSGSGIRTDEVGVEHGMPTKELGDAEKILFGRSLGWCNACGGSGKQEHFGCSYYFSVDNVKKFAEFLVDSGGFEIF